MKSSHKHEQLIVFTRYPEPGKTKTRLAGSLGHGGAADMQRKLTEHTISRVRQLQEIRPVEVHIYFAGGNLQHMRQWLGSDLIYRAQTNGDLGERLAGACADAFRNNRERVVIIGSDCPGIKPSHIARAYEALAHRDLVLGPASDGGYYLIGMNREFPLLFSRIPWSTWNVLRKTLQTAEKLGLSVEILEELSDVDRPEDLKHIDHHTDAE